MGNGLLPTGSCLQRTSANKCIRPLCATRPWLHPVHVSTPAMLPDGQLWQRNVLACSGRSSKRVPGTTYHAKLARHGQGVQDGSILRYWGSWRGWPAFKVVSNLSMLASLYDAHRLDIGLLGRMCPDIHDALAARAEMFSCDQASRTMLYLSRLHIVPQEPLWSLLATQVDAHAAFGVDQVEDQGEERCLWETQQHDDPNTIQQHPSTCRPLASSPI